jgi:hypothetical protein
VYAKKMDNGKSHLYTYDVDTKQHRLISMLDNAVESPKPALSPDRKWIVFRGKFRPTPEESRLEHWPGSIWMVSVDGAMYKRLISINFCVEKTPSVDDYKCYVQRPKWSHDGRKVWFAVSEYWEWPVSGTLDSVSSVHSVDVVTGEVGSIPNEHGCRHTRYPTPDHASSRIAVEHDDCSSLEKGVYVYDVNQPNRTGVRVSVPSHETITISWLQSQMFWAGRYLVLQAETEWPTRRGGTVWLKGYVGFDVVRGAVHRFLQPLAEPYSVHQASVSRNGLVEVYTVFYDNTKGWNLAIRDRRKKEDSGLFPITNDGRSLEASF